MATTTVPNLNALVLKRAAILGRSIRQSYIMAGPHRGLLLGATACGLFAALAEAGILITVVPLIYTLLGDSQGPGGLFNASKSITDSLLGNQETVAIIFVLLGVMYIKQVLSSSADTLIRWSEVRIVTHVRTTVLSNLLHSRFSHLDKLSTGWARQIVTGSSHEATGPVLRGAVRAISYSVQIAIVVGLMFHLSIEMTLVAIVAGLCLIPILYRYIRLIRRYSSRYMEDARRFANFANETIASIRSVKLLNAHRHFLDLAYRKSYEAYKKSFFVGTLSGWQPIILLSFAFLYIAGNVFYASWTQSNFGAELAYFFVLYRLITPVTGIFSAINLLLERLPFVEQVFEFYRPPPESLEQEGGKLLIADTISEIRLENVSMGYDSKLPILKNISLEARRGEIIAVVGESGAGKSTLLHLLLAMYPYDKGHVLIGGVEARDIDPISLRACAAIVSQDIHLFDTSIEENIRMGNAEISDEDVIEAAGLADVDRVIKQLPEGIQSDVGESGSLLSGGQRQRISIAQAIARKTPILILDEITSALDGGAERRVLDAIDSIRKDRIVIVITHRLTQLHDVDRIYVLDGGQIVEVGNWNDLMSRRGLFWQQYQRQLRVEETSGEEHGGERIA